MMNTIASSWIQCAVCGIEVPFDEALVPEAADQLTYLCGLESRDDGARLPAFLSVASADPGLADVVELDG